MAGELLSAVRSDYDPTKTLFAALSTFADINAKKKQQELQQQQLLISQGDLALRQKASEITNNVKAIELQEKQNAALEAAEFTRGLAMSTRDGRTLGERLGSPDKAVRLEAKADLEALTASTIKFSNPLVLRGIAALESTYNKANAGERSDARIGNTTTGREETQRHNYVSESQRDRSIDQRDTVIETTDAINQRKLDQGDQRIKTGERNADTSRMNAETAATRAGRLSGDDLDTVLTPKGMKSIKLNDAAKILALREDPNATKEQKQRADDLWWALKQTTSKVDGVDKTMYPDERLNGMRQLGKELLTPKAEPTPAGAPPVGKGSTYQEPALPTSEATPIPEDMPSLTPQSPSEPAWKKYLKKRGASVEPAVGNDLLNGTKQFLAGLSIPGISENIYKPTGWAASLPEV